MTRLRVTPGGRGGPGRLLVTRRDGTTVAWYDRDAGRISLFPGAGRDEVLAALAPYLTGQVSVGPPPVPTPADLDRLSLHPDDDLAPNRPGEALHGALDAAPDPGGGPGERWRRRLREAAVRAELAAQRDVGERLDRLDGAGWRVLHAIPLPGAAPSHVDHLAIGPAGVLAVRTVAARDRRVRIAGPLLRVGRAAPLPQLRWAWHAAECAALALATAVRPVLAVAEPRTLDGGPGGDVADVRVLRDTGIPALASLGGVLKPADIEALYATARDRRTWLSRPPATAGAGGPPGPAR
ncbi:nuclease-related domain-containing protein [Streptomyces corynorhini]|uniref:NERD domain-containing protein n=1 Tax=Streptomyces corynorhini TaxID=2282652 RepID=A0A370B2Y8_9ACTN|nr:nuclease-related domain-containing protein [Streptomyces corynorhini]RDG34223.1 NERD domain-containing protein [Streptomyces corynorhini]